MKHLPISLPEMSFHVTETTGDAITVELQEKQAKIARENIRT